MKFQITAILILSLSVISCIDEDGCDCCDKESEKMKSVSFKGVVNSDNAVKSSMTIPSGIRAVIIAYESGDNPASKSCYPATPLKVVSDQYGNLLIENETPLLMPVGNYDFYAISLNSDNQEKFEFESGKLKGLINGTDYLWATKKEVVINNTTNVTFDFRHKAVAIELDFFAGNGIDSLSVTSILASMSIEGGELLLSSGEITPSIALSSRMERVEIFKNTCRWIMLPLSGVRELPLKIEAYLRTGDRGELKRFVTSLPIENRKYTAGTLYKYLIQVEAESLSLGNTAVTEWTGICLDNMIVNE
ncbi:MAG: fimbrillin family protein [Bacteroidales bacterium]|nr:fimbrillin family protein [Bacteroidales bacterium]